MLIIPFVPKEWNFPLFIESCIVTAVITTTTLIVAFEISVPASELLFTSSKSEHHPAIYSLPSLLIDKLPVFSVGETIAQPL